MPRTAHLMLAQPEAERESDKLDGFDEIIGFNLLEDFEDDADA
jgi:hypothetical protein